MASTAMMHAGSSPLARGLHIQIYRCCPMRGIIPARAGFTSARYEMSSAWGDHPRSRGVYSPQDAILDLMEGSSPLARGLPSRLSTRRMTRRIIPARAGFTGSGRRGALTIWDHPRSRGVYRMGAAKGAARGGSSPLARGLPSGWSSRRISPRIIPARAGFTAPSRLPDPLGPDHPRSRGVYSNECQRHPPLFGIIPARAGFTYLLLCLMCVCADHPRSRGVYAFDCDANAREVGSSPLARGLRHADRVSGRRPGIIPARAGFTMPTSGPPVAPWDHPRSRGVYACGVPV